jgi:hypothetical protein
MQGKVILEQSITNAVQQLDVSMLPAGTYPWQIVYKNKVIESGKWVKK